jgi:hypothetical protein
MRSIKVHVAMPRDGVFTFTVTKDGEARKRFGYFKEAVAHARTLGGDDEIAYGANDIWVPLTQTPGIEAYYDEMEVWP